MLISLYGVVFHPLTHENKIFMPVKFLVILN